MAPAALPMHVYELQLVSQAGLGRGRVWLVWKWWPKSGSMQKTNSNDSKG